MTDAIRDNNQISTIIGASNADGSTPTRVKVNSSTHIVQTDDGVTGSDLSDDDASRDNNGIPIMLGVSSVDGITPVPIYVDPSNGKLLIKSS